MSNNPFEEIIPEIFSVKGVLQLMVILILVFVIFAITGTFKNSDINTPGLNESLENIEKATSSGLSWYIIISGIVGTIFIIGALVKFVTWLIEKFGNSKSYSFA